MRALNQIADILRAMGANPETITNTAGETVIKVNAPEIKKTGGQQKMIYLIIAITLLMAAATVCGCFRPGKAENICKYDNLED